CSCRPWSRRFRFKPARLLSLQNDFPQKSSGRPGEGEAKQVRKIQTAGNVTYPEEDLLEYAEPGEGIPERSYRTAEGGPCCHKGKSGENRSQDEPTLSARAGSVRSA